MKPALAFVLIALAFVAGMGVAYAFFPQRFSVSVGNDPLIPGV